MKNRLIQIALSVALLGLLIQIVLVAPSQIRDSETKAALLPAPDLAPRNNGHLDNEVDQRMIGMQMTETTEGHKGWQLWSEKALSVKAKDIWELERVKSIFLSDSGVTFTVTGNRGTVQTKTRNMRVEGDVVTRTSNGYVFRTESMDYDSVDRQLTAVNQVDMQGPRDSEGHSMHVRGVGMKASLQESNMEILTDVRAEKSLEGNRLAYIKSRRAIFSGKDKTAHFLENVIIDMDAMRITGADARFDYDAKSDTVRSVLVSGGARVSDTEKLATSQNVSVDFKQNKFVFRGDPRVVQNNDELRGEQIVFLDGGKQVQVEGARARVDDRRLEKKQ